MTYIEGCATDIAFSLKVRRGNIITCTLKIKNSIAANTVPVIVVPRTFIQTPLFLVHSIRHWSDELRSATRSLSLALLTLSCIFCPSRHSSLGARGRLALENTPFPIAAQIKYMLVHCELRYFFFADVTVFRMPRPDFLAAVVLRAPTMGERDFGFLRKSQGKNFSRSILSTPANMSPVLFLMRFRNIHSNCIARTTVE